MNHGLFVVEFDFDSKKKQLNEMNFVGCGCRGFCSRFQFQQNFAGCWFDFSMIPCSIILSLKSLFSENQVRNIVCD